MTLDALLMADGLVTNNGFFVYWGLHDYSNLLGSLDSSGQAQAQAECYHDFVIDYLVLSGAV